MKLLQLEKLEKENRLNWYSVAMGDQSIEACNPGGVWMYGLSCHLSIACRCDLQGNV
jgi:hypothetical protein